MNGYIEYKTIVFIKDVLEKQLKTYRDKLVRQQKDKKCPVENYENTLDFCTKLEYAIQEIERFKT